MITRNEILDFSEKYGVPVETIDKDYVLGHCLAGIFDNLYLKERLIFKGGTCLKKCYFGDYRFSEDLDFTAIASIDRAKIHSSFKKILQTISSEADILFGKCIIKDSLFENRLMGYKFAITFWGVNHPKNKIPNLTQNLPKIEIDITLNEKVYLRVEQKELIHPYSDVPVKSLMNCYSLAEIISEKLRAVLQRKHSVERDYYDLWYLLKNIDYNDVQNIKQVFQAKCKFKNIQFKSVEDFFPQAKLTNSRNHWQRSLGNHLRVLPEFDLMINELKSILCRYYE